MPDALERTFQPTRRVLGDVDPVQPLDTTHPLLDGVQGFWLPLPRLVGGSRLYDLSANSHHGDFSGLTSSDWSTDGERQFPFLRFPNDGDQVSCGRVHGSLDELTTFFWMRPLFNDSGIIQKGKARSAPDKHDWEVTQNNTNLVFKISDAASISSVTTPTPSLQEWHFVVCTWDGQTAEINVDGEVRASASLSTTMSNNHDFYIGGDPGSESPSNSNYNLRFFDGSLTAVGVLSNGWVGETMRIYDQARRGFPDLLNRRDSVGLLGGGGGGTADTVSPSTATALAEAFDPALTATSNTISAGTAQAAAQGFSATVTATQNTVSAGTAQATAQGFAPTISADLNTIGATTGQAGAQGFDPTISEGAAGDTITADLGTAQAQAFDPTITTNAATVTLGLGQATANGFNPDVVADPSEINTGQAQAAATGFDPTVTTNARTVTPQLGTAQAQGFEPAVVDGTVGVATTMEIEARPLYEIDVEAKPLYRIRLFVKEQLP